MKKKMEIKKKPIRINVFIQIDWHKPKRRWWNRVHKSRNELIIIERKMLTTTITKRAESILRKPVAMWWIRRDPKE